MSANASRGKKAPGKKLQLNRETVKDLRARGRGARAKGGVAGLPPVGKQSQSVNQVCARPLC